MYKFFIVVAVIGLSACTDVEGARKTIKDYGMSPVKVEGYSLFGCGQGDFYHTKFTAMNTQGREVSGIICKGLFKNSTMRLN